MRILSRIKVSPDRLEDAAGAVALFAILGSLLWIGHWLELPTSGDQLKELLR